MVLVKQLKGSEQMLLSEKVKLLATRANAEKYSITEDKFIYCLDLLEMDLSHKWADYAVNTLEDAFDDLLNPIAREDSFLPDDAWEVSQ